MEKKIAELKGKRIEVNCGNGVAFSGENLGLEDGVLTLEGDGSKRLFIDAAKIVVISEASDMAGRPGFIA
ncbi:MAG: MM0924 family protein [Pyrinomonadaceae bacterium]